jgi:Uncharacterized conserved protein
MSYVTSMIYDKLTYFSCYQRLLHNTKKKDKVEGDGNLYHVIFHIDEEEKWPLLLGNVKNLLAGMTAEVEVLANGSAVVGYKSKAFINQMISLKSQGVQFVACQNALYAHHLLKEDLFAFVSVVPAGVVELVEKQSSGYAYIKP